MKNPFLKRLIKEKSQDVVHSSAYAEAQNAGKIGSASMQGFKERQVIEQSRSMVKKYRDSRVVNEGEGARAKTYDANKDALQRAAIRERFGKKTENRFGGGDGGAKAPEPAKSAPPARRNPGISR